MKVSNNSVDGSPKDKSWLHSDIYDRSSPVKKPLPRTSISKFGSFGDAMSSLGKLVGQVVLYIILFTMLFILLVPGPEGWGSDQIYLAIAELVKLTCLTISVFIVIKAFDESEIVELGLKLNRRGLSDFLFGFTIILLIFVFEFVVYWVSGWLKIEHPAWETQSFTSVFWNMIAVLLIFIFVGWSEELFSRGFHLRLISKGLNRPLGIILSSAIFSYFHRNNSGITKLDLFFIFVFGVIMCFALLRSGQLWLAMGIHTGWDFFVAIFWGVPISDLRLFHLFDIKLSYQPAFYFLMRIIELAAMMILIRAYTANRKVEINDW